MLQQLIGVNGLSFPNPFPHYMKPSSIPFFFFFEANAMESVMIMNPKFKHLQFSIIAHIFKQNPRESVRVSVRKRGYRCRSQWDRRLEWGRTWWCDGKWCSGSNPRDRAGRSSWRPWELPWARARCPEVRKSSAIPPSPSSAAPIRISKTSPKPSPISP